MNELKLRMYNGEKMEYFTLNDVYYNAIDPSGGGVSEPIVMQYTGLKDSNDKELYFDDKVVLFYGRNQVDGVDVIGTLDDLVQLCLKISEFGASFEIVGNIHTN